MNTSQLKKALPRCDAAIFIGPVNSSMAEFGIVDRLDQAAFLANVGHETKQLTALSEDLNYRAARLLEVWPTRFTPTLAAQLAGKPEAIANHVYGGRFGNGDEASGDGWRFRGGGGIQRTFRDNYLAGAKHFNMTLPAYANWIRTPEGALRDAALYWTSRKCGVRAAAGDFDGACDLVNLGRKTEKVGDSIGYAGRLALFNAFKEVL